MNPGSERLPVPLFLDDLSQEWSPSHNLKSLRKKQLAAREAMARQTVASDTEVSSVESSVIRYFLFWFHVALHQLFLHRVPLLYKTEYCGIDSWVHSRHSTVMGPL